MSQEAQVLTEAYDAELRNQLAEDLNNFRQKSATDESAEKRT
jgi:hypothetical protein